MIKYSSEVAAAIKSATPIVALESTIISHGLPRPQNLEVALEVEKIVRENGATPATIALIDGVIHVGLEADELNRIANDDKVVKASTRDLAIIEATKQSAATTVAATSHIAHLAGIKVFATGGLGGVHRGHSYDESADLHALGEISIVIVCAGVKSILDVSGTLERLESFAIPVLGYQTNKFPGFYLTDSGFEIEHRVNSPAEIAAIWANRIALASDNCAIVVANPVVNQMNPELHDKVLTAGLAAAQTSHITGKAVTPFLLEYFHRESAGESLRVNIDIIKSNAKLAAQIACAL
ncbi:MAG: pseudouridine-5'-phosphate glycosidase [Actinobacteria bacterium]|jgi:pseudouridine-5'-phosphate glycosidase|nr:pseudouridine-5'-phosphate glycosidase [Actinomycetota bacterium]